MQWDLHGLTVLADWNDGRIGDRWQAAFGSRPLTVRKPDIIFSFDLTAAAPQPPPGKPSFQQPGLLEYYFIQDNVIAHFPRFGQLRLNFSEGTTRAEIVSQALDAYAIFEDLVAIGLAPHLRRRRRFLLHAFAAVQPPTQPETSKAVLIVGQIGAGKTTTGMALLQAGWRLLSNDSPILAPPAQILSYPGLLAAYPDTLARFPATHTLSELADPARKITVAAESVWPNIWAEQASAGAIIFPKIENRSAHALDPLSQPEALRLLLPHAIEQWDQELIPEHLAVLRQLVQSAPAFRLRLGPDTDTIPSTINSALSGVAANLSAR